MAAEREARQNGGSTTTARPPEHVQHYQQHHSWDCGVACVVMALWALRGTSSGDAAAVYAAVAVTSVWTIDLAHLLAHFGCQVTFHTLTFGADAAYCHEAFYKRTLTADSTRVSRLFSVAEQAGVHLMKGSLTWQDIRAILARGDGLCLAIVLVDKWALRGGVACCCGLSPPGYTGALRYSADRC